MVRGEELDLAATLPERRPDRHCVPASEHARVLHMPGELLIEYQLAAQQLRPDLFVAMAAYGDYAPGYIATEIAYSQGGYETSRVRPALLPVSRRF